MKEGKSVFVRRGAHIAEKFEGDGWCVMIFFMPDKYLQQFIKENRSALMLKNLPEPKNDYVIELNVNEITEGFFYSMLPYFSQQPPPGIALLDLKFTELILSILSNPINKNLLSYINTLNDTYAQSLQEIMEENYMFNLSLEQYANLACRSLASFKRDFSKLYKTTPAKWLKDQRLKLAGDLLHSSSMSVHSIAYDCGFENTSHFCRAFKEKFNISPLQYRTTSSASGFTNS